MAAILASILKPTAIGLVEVHFQPTAKSCSIETTVFVSSAPRLSQFREIANRASKQASRTAGSDISMPTTWNDVWHVTGIIQQTTTLSAPPLWMLAIAHTGEGTCTAAKVVSTAFQGTQWTTLESAPQLALRDV